jgi:hypothetical protein
MNASPAAREKALERIRVETAETELALKKADLQNAQRGKSLLSTIAQPNVGLIIGGVVGIISALVANVIQSRSAVELERQKLESTLIIKAVETLDPAVSSRNLHFLLSAGLIRDPDGRIARASTPQVAPVFATPSGQPIRLTQTQRASFFDNYERVFGPVDQATTRNLTSIFDYLERNPRISDIRTLAYTLATIKYETHNTFEPQTAPGNPEFWERVQGPSTGPGRFFGHTQPGDATRYRGRGYLPLTGKRNYAAMSRTLGLLGTPDDLEANPDGMLTPEIAFRATIVMLTDGTMTGRKLSDYITGQRADYRNARRVVNGIDHADAIAGLAAQFERILRTSMRQ